MIRALVKSTSFQQRRILKAKIRSTTYPCTEMIVQLFTDHQELEEFLQDINLRCAHIAVREDVTNKIKGTLQRKL